MSKKITALKVQKNNKARVNVFLDGEFAFGLSRIVAAWLELGQVLSSDKIEELKNEDLYEQAYQQAIHFLSYRSRSEHEVQENLRKHQYADEVIDHVIARCTENGLVDDRRFAAEWISNRNEFNPRGRKALRYELRQKHINPQVIEEALDSLEEESLAYKAARRRIARLDGLEWKDFRRKMSGYLSRRGFSYEITREVVQKIWEEQQLTP